MSDTLCVLPFNQLSVGTTGDLRLCCNSLAGPIEDNNASVMVNGQTDLKFFTESPHLNSIRKTLLAGGRPKECGRCWTMEKAGQQSFRNFANGEYVTTFNRLLSGDTSVSLEYLNFDLGNKCNIACRMCHPYSSSLLAKEMAHGKGELSNDEVASANGALRDAEALAWFEKPEFWEMIKPRLKEVRRVYLIGGEPFLIPEHLKLLDLLIEYGLPKEITLSYNSNLSVFPERIFDRWRKFKTVKVQASIDGINKVYEYIRWPMKFDRIAANLNLLREERLENVLLSIHATIQNLNVSYLTELLDFFYGMDIVFIPVHRPSYLSVSVMPFEELKLALAKLEDYQRKLKPSRSGHFERAVEEAVRFVSDAVRNYVPQPELQAQFLKSMAFYDRRRNQSLLEVHPYFKPWTEL